jgi:4'-phosphopantetheinyl transferase
MSFSEQAIPFKHSTVHLLHYQNFDPSTFLDYLTDIERERYFAFTHPHRQREFVATRYLRHQLFGFEHIHYDHNGAPYIRSEGYISISHTHGIVGIAFNKEFQIGLDIETRSERARRVFSRFLSDEEIRSFDTSNADEMTVAWCAKETLYKISNSKSIDFRNQLSLKPNGISRLLGEIKIEEIQSTAEIHTFVSDQYVLTINESPLQTTNIF